MICMSCDIWYILYMYVLCNICVWIYDVQYIVCNVLCMYIKVQWWPIHYIWVVELVSRCICGLPCGTEHFCMLPHISYTLYNIYTAYYVPTVCIYHIVYVCMYVYVCSMMIKLIRLLYIAVSPPIGGRILVNEDKCWYTESYIYVYIYFIRVSVIYPYV